MKLIDNINELLGDDLRRSITPGAKLKIAASCFSIYAFAELKPKEFTVRLAPTAHADMKIGKHITVSCARLGHCHGKVHLV